MSETKLIRAAYEKLIAENIEAIERSNMTPMEAAHTICVLRDSVRCYYDSAMMEELTAAKNRLAAVEDSNSKYEHLIMHLRQELIGKQKRVAELEQHSHRLAARWENLTSELDKDLAEVVSRLSDDLTAANQRAAELEQALARPVANIDGPSPDGDDPKPAQ